jgi:hypothetical protein
MTRLFTQEAVRRCETMKRPACNQPTTFCHSLSAASRSQQNEPAGCFPCCSRVARQLEPQQHTSQLFILWMDTVASERDNYFWPPEKEQQFARLIGGVQRINTILNSQIEK